MILIFQDTVRYPKVLISEDNDIRRYWKIKSIFVNI
jgi:hypothetical protein